jgi:hypothetical protein
MSAELNMMRFFVEHNLPMNAADHCGSLFRTMFTDPVAKDYKCGRTKMTALIKYEAERIAADISGKCNKVFTVSTDGSNDNEDKCYPMVISFVDDGKPRCALLSVPTVKDASCTGENIFKTLDAELKRFGMSWDNCIALGSDNAPVMIGAKKGVYGLLKKEAPAIYSSGCPCHLLHIAAKNAWKELDTNIEEILTDVYYYLKHSAKRLAELKALQELHGQNLKVLKHVPTRWLSLHKCVERLLLLRPALLDFFNKEKGDSGRANRVYK